MNTPAPENRPATPSEGNTLKSHQLPPRPCLSASVFGYLFEEGGWYPSEVTPIIVKGESLYTVPTPSGGDKPEVTPLPLTDLVNGKLRWERMPSTSEHLLHPDTQGLFALSREKIVIFDLSERSKLYRELLSDRTFMIHSPRTREYFAEKTGDGLLLLRELVAVASSYRICDPAVADSVMEPRHKKFKECNPRLAGIAGAHWRDLLEIVVMPDGEGHPVKLANPNLPPPPMFFGHPRGH